ncbi:hypothetical protein HHK36_026372 [Tetracentron sinense]|uniref:RING-type E3 ubiquitin transferase n=1 Tax=Tetracentron sinense TaxID=13715 RepID=A0A835D252_TETSI|nr:hypothetical protein HHK36_026372 [Tetracentron sinense]
MDDNSAGIPQHHTPVDHFLSKKIMLSATVMLFTVIFLVLCLHFYARWFLLRSRTHHLRRSQHRTHLVFYSDPTNTLSQGLEPSILTSLPTFLYSSTTTHDQVLECAVCLSEFEDKDEVRLLPKCNHSFHIDCIDMWFHSHSTCPLCRVPVKPDIPVPVTETMFEIVVSVGEPVEAEAGSSSGVCSSCQHCEDEMGCSSSSPLADLGSRRKPLELQRRNDSFGNLDEEFGLGSPRGQGFKSPRNRILSLKRILSRDKMAVLSRSASALSCSSVTDNDVERGREEAQPLRTQEPQDDS